MDAVVSFLYKLISSLDPKFAFESLGGFLSSGYIVLIFAAFLVYSLTKKAITLICTCIVLFGIWFFFSHGYGDFILSPLQEMIWRVSNGIH